LQSPGVLHHTVGVGGVCPKPVQAVTWTRITAASGGEWRDQVAHWSRVSAVLILAQGIHLV